MDNDRKLIRYLETLVIPSGDLAGERMTVFPWEARFIRGAFRVAGDCAVSVARGNGKSGLVAGIATAALDPDGPLDYGRADIVAVASSFEQGKVIFEDVLAFIRAKHGYDLPRTWRIQDSANRAMIEHKPTGTRVRCIGSDPKRAHGLRPGLVLADEGAQWQHTKADAMLAALRTGLGKIPDSKLIALGTRPADSNHWFAKMLDGGAAYCQTHAVPVEEKRIFQYRTWCRANPSLKYLPSLVKRIREEADEARADEALLPSFRALRLNQGTEDVIVRLLLTGITWEAVEGEAAARGPYVLGIDLGGSAAMSAAAGYWLNTGRLNAFSLFGSIPDLRKRGLRDGVGRLYSRMFEVKELLLSPGRTADHKQLIREALRRWGRPVSVVADRYRKDEFMDLWDSLRLSSPVEFRGQGWRDGAADVLAFRRHVLEGKVTPTKSLLLRAAMSEARTLANPAGFEKLAKGSQGQRRSRARDDAAAAAILAVAEGHRIGRKPARRVPDFFVVGAND